MAAREWLACLDPARDARRGFGKIRELSQRPSLRGDWFFERHAADFLNDIASHEKRLWKKRVYQKEAWAHSLLALRDTKRQASAKTAWLLAARLVQVGLRDEALDLRPGELALVLPLVACLIALSVWPALVSQSSFPGDRPARVISEGFR